MLGTNLRKGRTRLMEKVVWQSTLTDEMVFHLSEVDTNLLINSLNEAVEQVCDIYEVKG